MEIFLEVELALDSLRNPAGIITGIGGKMAPQNQVIQKMAKILRRLGAEQLGMTRTDIRRLILCVRSLSEVD